MDHFNFAQLIQLVDKHQNYSALITAVLAVAGCILLGRKRKVGCGVEDLRKPPNGHWLWGHERIATFDILDFQWWRRNTPIYGLTYASKGAFFHPDFIVMADPAGLNHMFTKHAYRYPKAELSEALFERLTGRGLLWANGGVHRRQRQVVAPFFSHAQVRRSEEDIIPVVTRAMEKLEEQISTACDSESSALRYDIQLWMNRTALDVLGVVAFGLDFGFGQSIPSKAILGTYVKPKSGPNLVAWAAPLVLRAFPWLTAKLFDFTEAQNSAKNVVRTYVSRELWERRRKGEEDRPHADLLDVLMKNINMDDPAQVDEALDQVNTVIIAGFETVAKELTMAMYELATDQKLQNALREEITSFVGSRPDGKPSYDDLMGDKLPLLDAVFKEVIRFHPVAPLAERQAREDDVIPLRHPIQDKHGNTVNSIHVKKGQVFWIPIRVINTAPIIWGPDGDKFDAYRWLDSARVPSSSETASGIYGTFTFLEGTRLCIGWRMAVYEAKLILSELVRRFQWARVPGENIDIAWNVTIQPFISERPEEGSVMPLIFRAIH